MTQALGRPAATSSPAPADSTETQLGLAAIVAEVNAGDPQSFYQEADAFTQVVNHLQDVVSQFRNQTRQLDSAWSGSSADALSEVTDHPLRPVSPGSGSAAQNPYRFALLSEAFDQWGAQSSGAAGNQDRSRSAHRSLPPFVVTIGLSPLCQRSTNKCLDPRQPF